MVKNTEIPFIRTEGSRTRQSRDDVTYTINAFFARTKTAIPISFARCRFPFIPPRALPILCTVLTEALQNNFEKTQIIYISDILIASKKRVRFAIMRKRINSEEKR